MNNSIGLALWVIAIILLIGLIAFLGLFSYIVWTFIGITVFFFIVWAISDDIKQQKQRNETKQLQKEYERLNPCAPKKTWFGLTIQRIPPKPGEDESKEEYEIF